MGSCNSRSAIWGRALIFGAIAVAFASRGAAQESSEENGGVTPTPAAARQANARSSGDTDFRRIFVPSGATASWPRGSGKLAPPIDEAEFLRLLQAARSADQPGDARGGISQAVYVARLAGDGSLTGGVSFQIRREASGPVTIDLGPCDLSLVDWRAGTGGAGGGDLAEADSAAEHAADSIPPDQVALGVDRGGRLTLLAGRNVTEAHCDWRLPHPVRRQSQFSFRAALPRAAVQRMRLLLPSGWTVTSPTASQTGKPAPAEDDLHAHEFRIPPSARLELTLIPPGVKEDGTPARLAEQSVRVTYLPGRVEALAQIRIAASHRAADDWIVTDLAGLRLAEARFGEIPCQVSLLPATEDEPRRYRVALDWETSRRETGWVDETNATLTLKAVGQWVDRTQSVPLLRLADTLYERFTVWAAAGESLVISDVHTTAARLIADASGGTLAPTTGRPEAPAASGAPLVFEIFGPDARIDLSLTRRETICRVRDGVSLDVGTSDAVASQVSHFEQSGGLTFEVGGIVAPGWTIATVDAELFDPAEVEARDVLDQWRVWRRPDGNRELRIALTRPLKRGRTLRVETTTQRVWRPGSELPVAELTPVRWERVVAAPPLLGLRAHSAVHLEMSDPLQEHYVPLVRVTEAERDLLVLGSLTAVFRLTGAQAGAAIAFFPQRPVFDVAIDCHAVVKDGWLKEQIELELQAGSSRPETIDAVLAPADGDTSWRSVDESGREFLLKAELTAAGAAPASKENGAQRQPASAHPTTAAWRIAIPVSAWRRSDDTGARVARVIGVRRRKLDGGETPITLASVPAAHQQRGVVVVDQRGSCDYRLARRQLTPIFTPPPENMDRRLGSFRFQLGPEEPFTEPAALVVARVDRPVPRRARATTANVETFRVTATQRRHHIAIQIENRRASAATVRIESDAPLELGRLVALEGDGRRRFVTVRPAAGTSLTLEVPLDPASSRCVAALTLGEAANHPIRGEAVTCPRVFVEGEPPTGQWVVHTPPRLRTIAGPAADTHIGDGAASVFDTPAERAFYRRAWRRLFALLSFERHAAAGADSVAYDVRDEADSTDPPSSGRLDSLGRQIERRQRAQQPLTWGDVLADAVDAGSEGDGGERPLLVDWIALELAGIRPNTAIAMPLQPGETLADGPDLPSTVAAAALANAGLRVMESETPDADVLTGRQGSIVFETSEPSSRGWRPPETDGGASVANPGESHDLNDGADALARGWIPARDWAALRFEHADPWAFGRPASGVLPGWHTAVMRVDHRLGRTVRLAREWRISALAWAGALAAFSLAWWLGRRSFSHWPLLVGGCAALCLALPDRWAAVGSGAFLGSLVAVAPLALRRLPRRGGSAARSTGNSSSVIRPRQWRESGSSQFARPLAIALAALATAALAAELLAQNDAGDDAGPPSAADPPIPRVLTPFNPDGDLTGKVYLPQDFYNRLQPSSRVALQPRQQALIEACDVTAHFAWDANAALVLDSAACEITIRTTAENQTVMLPLPAGFAAETISAVTIDGVEDPAPLEVARDEDAAALRLTLKQPGRRRVSLSFDPAVEIEGDTALAPLPIPPAARLSVAVHKPAVTPAVETRVDGQTWATLSNGHSRADLPTATAPQWIGLVWPIDVRRGEPTLQASYRRHTWLNVSPSAICIRTHLCIDVQQGRAHTFRLRVAGEPPLIGVRATADGGPIAVSRGGAGDEGTIELAPLEPITGRVHVSLVFAAASETAPLTVVIPQVTLDQASLTSASVAVSAEPPLTPKVEGSAELRPMETQEFWDGFYERSEDRSVPGGRGGAAAGHATSPPQFVAGAVPVAAKAYRLATPVDPGVVAVVINRQDHSFAVSGRLAVTVSETAARQTYVATLTPPEPGVPAGPLVWSVNEPQQVQAVFVRLGGGEWRPARWWRRADAVTVAPLAQTKPFELAVLAEAAVTPGAALVIAPPTLEGAEETPVPVGVWRDASAAVSARVIANAQEFAVEESGEEGNPAAALDPAGPPPGPPPGLPPALEDAALFDELLAESGAAPRPAGALRQAAALTASHGAAVELDITRNHPAVVVDSLSSWRQINGRWHEVIDLRYQVSGGVIDQVSLVMAAGQAEQFAVGDVDAHEVHRGLDVDTLRFRLVEPAADLLRLRLTRPAGSTLEPGAAFTSFSPGAAAKWRHFVIAPTRLDRRLLQWTTARLTPATLDAEWGPVVEDLGPFTCYRATGQSFVARLSRIVEPARPPDILLCEAQARFRAGAPTTVCVAYTVAPRGSTRLAVELPENAELVRAAAADTAVDARPGAGRKLDIALATADLPHEVFLEYRLPAQDTAGGVAALPTLPDASVKRTVWRAVVADPAGSAPADPLETVAALCERIAARYETLRVADEFGARLGERERRQWLESQRHRLSSLVETLRVAAATSPQTPEMASRVAGLISYAEQHILAGAADSAAPGAAGAALSQPFCLLDGGSELAGHWGARHGAIDHIRRPPPREMAHPVWFRLAAAFIAAAAGIVLFFLFRSGAAHEMLARWPYSILAMGALVWAVFAPAAWLGWIVAGTAALLGARELFRGTPHRAPRPNQTDTAR